MNYDAGDDSSDGSYDESSGQDVITNDFKDILRTTVLFPRPLPHSETCGHFKQQPLCIDWKIHVKSKVGKKDWKIW